MLNPPLKISQSALKTIGRKRVSAAELESLESEVSEPKDIEEVKAEFQIPLERRDSFSLDPEAYRSSMYEFQGRLNFTQEENRKEFEEDLIESSKELQKSTHS